MCGITGIWDLTQSSSSNVLHYQINKMNNALAHRGPDSNGVWANKEIGLALGHTRLAIMDLSPHGHQPMQSECKRFQIVFNGEIYNFLDIKKNVESIRKYSWRGDSDTEVLLASFSMFGVEETIKSLNGMFSIALFDENEQNLYLVRDRMGEKPLYYGIIDQKFVFSSELKAISSLFRASLQVSKKSLSSYISFNYVPAPFSIYEGVYKLSPSSYMKINYGLLIKELVSPDHEIKYWSLDDVAANGGNDILAADIGQIVNSLDKEIGKAVSMRMHSDVPLGSFLSGGYDSSLVSAMMQSRSMKKIKTFSIGFEDNQYNEAKHAKAIADYLGTDHTEYYLNPKQSLDIIPKLSDIYCEPFADASQIPTFQICNMASEKVTVALTGDGGDELFAGYNRHFIGKAYWDCFRNCPPSMKVIISKVINLFPPSSWDQTLSFLINLLPSRYSIKHPGAKLYKLDKAIQSDSLVDFYLKLTSHWQPQTPLLVSDMPDFKPVLASNELYSFSKNMQMLDMKQYLPDGVLTKVDRASMAASIESRAPLLDHNLVEFSWRIPDDLKIRRNQGKWIFKEVVHKYIPKEMMERPKMGFSIPLGEWLRTDLRDWVEALLSKERLVSDGFFDAKVLHNKWAEHIKGTRNWENDLWSVLMFQSWLEKNYIKGSTV